MDASDGTWPSRLRDLAFFSGFAVYTAGALFLLASGLAAMVASGSEQFHEALHVRALSDDLLSRVAQRVADGAHQVQPAGQAAVDYGFSLLNLVLAGFLLWLRPGDRTARLLAVGMVGTAAAFNLEAQGTYSAIPLTSNETIIAMLHQGIAAFAYMAALILFPDGRLIPRWRWPALVLLYGSLALLSAALLLALTGAGGFLGAGRESRPTALLPFFGLLVPLTGVASQAYRFGRSPSREAHQQARLLFLALLPALAIGTFFVVTRGIGLDALTAMAGRPQREVPVITFRIFLPVFALIPAALLVGLMRYRLWDVDRVLNRTLVYSTVTALLAAVYVGAVLVLQTVMRPFTRSHDVAVALSTVLVMGGFRPVRTRVQSFVDRRFNRRRYDAAKTIEDFSHVLRDQIDLDAMTVQLRGVVRNTMQPTHVSIWMRRLGDTAEAQHSARNVPATPSG